MFIPDMGGLISRGMGNSLSLYLFLELDPYLGKSDKFNNQRITKNRAFRILFVSKKQ